MTESQYGVIKFASYLWGNPLNNKPVNHMKAPRTERCSRIWLNFPVKDLDKSKQFFRDIGFSEKSNAYGNDKNAKTLNPIIL